MFKKIVSIILCVAMLAAFALVASSCGNSKDDFKLGVILLHDEDSTYDLNFINAVKDAQKQLGLKDSQVIFKRGIPEGNECYEAAGKLELWFYDYKKLWRKNCRESELYRIQEVINWYADYLRG